MGLNPRPEFAAVERIELDAAADFFRAAPPALRAAHAIEVQETPAATCFLSRGLEPPAMFRRAAGLGVERATNEGELDEVLARMDAPGLRYAVTHAPQAQPAALGAWLEKRGFARGYAWMKFCRRTGDAHPGSTDLEIRIAGATQAEDFGRVVAEGFGMPAALAPWIGALAGRPGWVCVIAYDGAQPAGAGGAYVAGEYAWIGFGATLAAYRRRGAQGALLARRLREAAARGARFAVTETGERLPDKPSHSYRNILRAGFEEAYLRQNYLSPERTTGSSEMRA